jgi:hypothetical protein
MTSVLALLSEVRRIIHDEDATLYRWSDDELIDYVNAAQRQTVQLIPESYTLDTVVTINNFIARQSLPAGGIKFLRVGRNYADNGTTPQGPVRYVEKDALDSFNPQWEYDGTLKTDGANYFENYCHDPREPTAYYLYPPQAAATSKKISIVYSAVPGQVSVSEPDDLLILNDEYFNALVQYVIYRALTKESRETLPDAYRQELWQNYLTALGLQKQATKEAGPGENRPPEGP